MTGNFQIPKFGQPLLGGRSCKISSSIIFLILQDVVIKQLALYMFQLASTKAHSEYCLY